MTESNLAQEKHVRHQNRRLGAILISTLVVLYIVAIVGIIVLN